MNSNELSTFMHDIRGRLTVIKNAVAFILEGRTGEVSEKTKEFLDEINKRNEELIAMTFQYKERKENDGENTSG